MKKANKATLTLDKIEQTTHNSVTKALINVAIQFVNPDATEETETFKFRCTHHAIRLVSDHRVDFIKLLVKWLDATSTIRTAKGKTVQALKSNQDEVLIFCRKMLDAHTQLQETKTICKIN